jgi:hypothetical protein
VSNDPRDPYGYGGGDPYGQPPARDPLAARDPYAEHPTTDAIRGRVTGPAIFMIIVSVLNLLIGLATAGNGIYLASIGPDEMHRRTLAGLEAFPAMKKVIEQQDKQTTYNTTLVEYLGGGVLWLLLSLVALFGSIRMLALKSYGLAITAAFVTAIPCVTPCCLLGQAAGIWGLVVLFNPEVRSAFR